jgi:nucleoside-diphosphate-sugar epimerase
MQKSRRILIVGNMGYIGPVLAGHLRVQFPDSVIAGFDAGYFAGCLMDPTDFPERILDRQYFGDVRRFPESILGDFDTVVALAAVSNDPMGARFEQATMQINRDAVVDIARAAKNAGVSSYVFASSCSVYGEGGSEAKTEDSAINPLTAYARSKVEAEQKLAGLAGENFRVTCLRFATACGWSPRLRLDLVLNDFVASALTTGKIQILSDGSPWRPLIHIRDMARSIEWAATRDRIQGGDIAVINAGSDSWNFTIRDLAMAVAGELDGIEVSINPNASPDKRSYRVDFSRFAEWAPAHQPTMTPEATVTEILGGLRACGFQDANFRQSRFIRLNVLSGAVDRGILNQNLFTNRDETSSEFQTHGKVD